MGSNPISRNRRKAQTFLAQLVEHVPLKHRVVGSSPTEGTGGCETTLKTQTSKDSQVVTALR